VPGLSLLINLFDDLKVEQRQIMKAVILQNTINLSFQLMPLEVPVSTTLHAYCHYPPPPEYVLTYAHFE
jgi:hypothetical protein